MVINIYKENNAPKIPGTPARILSQSDVWSLSFNVLRSTTQKACN